jgi:hypothetical protein
MRGAPAGRWPGRRVGFPVEGWSGMILRDPVIDLVLPILFAALALVAAVDFARAGWPDAAGLCVLGFLGGLLWARTVSLPAVDDRRGEDG